MPPRGRPPKFVLPERTLIIDNGAYSIKAGFASESPSTNEDCHVIPNTIAKNAVRTWVGPQLKNCTDFAEMAFRRPVQRGYLVNWEAEREIWDLSFFDSNAELYCDPHETNLVLTEASNGPAALQTNCDQMVFEEFEFAAYKRVTGPALNAYIDTRSLFNDPPREGKDQQSVEVAECLLVVDSGHSHTIITPLYQGRPIQQAVRRLDIGGKFLTNVLKEQLSVRQVDVRDETYMINDMKEAACYVSQDFRADMDRLSVNPSDGSIVVNYVMPDYVNRHQGEVRPYDPSVKKQMSRLGFVLNAQGQQESLVTLGIERFAIPELLFNPSDIGMQQIGLPEIIMHSLNSVPTDLWAAMLANVLVIGGNAGFTGFTGRIRSGLRALAPAECTVRVERAPDHLKSTWLGGARLASDRSRLKEVLVTRQDYMEHGSAWLAQVFAGDKYK